MRSWVFDVLAVAGWGAIAAGIGMLNLPAGIITAGVGLLAAGIIGAWLHGGTHAE